MDATIKPNPNDINAPSKNDIAPFVKPKDVTWDDADQAKFDSGWDFFDPKLHGAEAIARITLEVSTAVHDSDASPRPPHPPHNHVLHTSPHTPSLHRLTQFSRLPTSS